MSESVEWNEQADHLDDLCERLAIHPGSRAALRYVADALRQWGHVIGEVEPRALDGYGDPVDEDNEDPGTSGP